MNGHEEKLVQTLKGILSDVSTVEYTDFDYLRWLQGHDYNLDVIIPKLRHHFLCLRAYDFENYEKKNDEVMENYCMYGLLKSTGKGQFFPYIDTQGTWDGEGTLKSVSKVDITLHRMFKSEQALKVVRRKEQETGRQSGVIYIVDLEGLHMSPKKMQLLAGPYKHLINFLFKHYVEILQQLIIINAPTVIWTLYNLIKPVLPEKTRQKFIVLGSNWKSELLQYCDPDTLPVHYGGTMVGKNNDPKCSSQIIYTTKVPERLYWSPSAKDPKPEELTILTVPAGRASFITIEVTKEHGYLEWYYNADGNWGFCIFFTESENETKTDEMEMVFPQFDFVSGPTIIPEKGTIKCKKLGFYKIWFNNYFSWFTKLTVRYKINLTS